ncbi:MAG TPA: phosphatase PAP2 family protein [Dehalococcoidia bacterium]|nr:phosphatase PAP2 family protein [Dehalococcoidia bacterium]
MVLDMVQRLAPAVGKTVRVLNKSGIWDLALIIVAFIFYYLVRGSVVERAPEATSRAIRLVELEQQLGLFWEKQLQSWAMSSDLLIRIANWIYVYAHFPLIVGIGLALFFFQRKRYILYRNAFLVAGGIGLIFFNWLPMAPPRLLPWPYGLVDTMAAFSRVNYDMQPAAFVNQYGALPSVHFAWNMLLGMAVFGMSRNLLLKAFGVVMPLGMAWAIVVTANHFILDIILGAVVGLVGLAVALAWQHYSELFWRSVRQVWQGKRQDSPQAVGQ